jgi:hypothetical protein
MHPVYPERRFVAIAFVLLMSVVSGQSNFRKEHTLCHFTICNTKNHMEHM